MTRFGDERPLEKVANIRANFHRFIEELPWDWYGTKDWRGDRWKGRYEYWYYDVEGELNDIGWAITHALGERGKWVWTIMKTEAGNITSPHSDAFKDTARVFRQRWVDRESARDRYFRFWIPMEDRKMGHVFEVENGPCLTSWKAGDVFIAPSSCIHCAATYGSDPRYTLVLNGLIDSDNAARHEYAEHDVTHVGKLS